MFILSLKSFIYNDAKKKPVRVIIELVPRLFLEEWEEYVKSWFQH